MRLSLALVALVAVVPAFANAIPPRVRHGTSIPLSKRAVQLKDNNGVANKRLLTSLGTRPSRKLRRDFAAYKRSAGEPSATRASGAAFERDDGSGGAPLIDDNDLFWHASILVGTPPVNFTVNIDTDRSDLFLPGTTCGSTCQGHKIYDTAASSTAKDLDQTFETFYDDGPSVKGEVFAETVTLAGLTVPDQSIGVASRYADALSFDEFPLDGVMGFGFSEFSQIGTTFIDNLVAESVVDVAQFSFKLTAEDGELFLGGANSLLFTGEFTTLNITHHGSWQITVDSVNTGGRPAVGVTQTIIDIGFPVTTGPTQDVVQFYQAINGSKDAPDTFSLPDFSGIRYFSIPCDTDPQVSFSFGGKQFDWTVDSFILGQVTEGSTDCIGGIAGTDDDAWFFGDNFLQNYYTRFDSGAKQVGFADLA